MSLVGARPEVPEYVDASSPAWIRILSERPGVTGLASLIFRNEEALLRSEKDPDRFYREWILPSKLALNLEYLSARSLLTDWRVLALTAKHSLLTASPDAAVIREAVLRTCQR
jgi:lipopolysaccharide/colanic/teichoic acid biosynthesis glycosyltransferase